MSLFLKMARSKFELPVSLLTLAPQDTYDLLLNANVVSAYSNNLTLPPTSMTPSHPSSLLIPCHLSIRTTLL